MTMYGDYNGSKSYARETCSHLFNLNYYKTKSSVIDKD